MLEKASVGAPRLTAEVLLAHALQKDRTFLFAHANESLTELAWIHYGRYLHRRLQGEPTQYITGKQEFYGRNFAVNPSVLIPRPETEHLVEAALAAIPSPDRWVVDIGTGSGAIAVTVQLETGCRMFASDISGEALETARRNALTLGAKVTYFQSDLASALGAGVVDLVLSNPPYIGEMEFDGLQREVKNHEPYVALIGGRSGIEPYQKLVPEIRRCLKPGGQVIFEIGYQGAEAVTGLLSSQGFSGIEVIHDLAGWPRTMRASLGS
jgi:release factor glutamine methyltransferase